MTQPMYSNHDGTMKESFAIGKQGIKLLQGTTLPTGLTAPAGSLYVLRASSGVLGRVFQIDDTGNWTALLSPSDLLQGIGVTVATNPAGQVTISSAAYETSFNASNLMDFEGDGSADDIVITHNLGKKYVIAQVWNDMDQIIAPDHITAVDENTVAIDLTSYMPIMGTWNVCVKP